MKISTASVLAIAITLASTNSTLAQTSMNLKDETTAHLQWRPMAIASFNYGRINVPDVSRADMNLARTVWNKEINSAPLDDDGTKLPSFILVSSVTNQGVQYTFSIFSSAGTPGCIEPGNGSGIEDMYETCPLRVTEFQGSQSRTQEFQNYCHLYPFPPDHPGDVNQTEFAFDEKNMTAHFRVIQHGKHVPACDRKLALR